MQFKQYNDVNVFYEAAYTLLMCHEAQNLIPLGNLIIGKKGEDKSGWRDPVGWFMATVSDTTGVQLVAIRKKGYATSCVAKLSQVILDKGFKKCVLYTDMANPTSNSIYQKIGYQPICDSVMLKFVQHSST